MTRSVSEESVIMDDNFTRHIANTFRRTYRKVYENYVITGVWHRLRAKGILLEPVSQQYVRRPNGYALLDLFFPALNLSVECDEGYHVHQAEADRKRTLDVIAASEMDPLRAISALRAETFEELRVACTKVSPENARPVFLTLADIDNQIAEVVEKIEQKWRSCGSPTWDARKPLEKLKETGCLRIVDRWVFRTHEEVYSGFNLPNPKDEHPYKKIPGRDDVEICTQTLTIQGVQDGRWTNVLSEDGKTLIEKEPDSGLGNRAENGWRKLKQRLVDRREFHRIIFGKTCDFFGSSGYVFLGQYKLAAANLNSPRHLVWERIKDEVKIREVYPEGWRR